MSLVAGCGLQVTSFRLQVSSFSSRFQVAGFSCKVTSCRLQVCYQLPITYYLLPVMVAGYRFEGLGFRVHVSGLRV
jgi:hypothetical protein